MVEVAVVLIDGVDHAGCTGCLGGSGLSPVLFIGAIQGLIIQSALADDEAAMNARARELFRLLLHGYRGAAGG